LVLIVAFLLIGFVINFLERRRAEHLVRDLKTLEVGVSSAQDAMQIVSRYDGWKMPDPDPNDHDVAPWGIGPCSGPHPRYAIRVAPDSLNRAVSTVPQLQHFGFHIWGVSSTIDVKDGKVCCFAQYVGFQRSDGQDIETQSEMAPEHSEREVGTYAVHQHFIRNYIHNLSASVLPSASKDEKSRAFKVEFACVTSLRGCFYGCQLAPAVWEDVSQRYKREGWAVEGENDPRCVQQNSSKP
jgi:hypothetical protein